MAIADRLYEMDGMMDPGLETQGMAVAFDFVDINPGMSGMAFAAEAEGGTCVGVLSIPETEKAAYEAFHGRGSAEGPSHGSRLILASLPFSMFAEGKAGDPAVSHPIRAAAKAAHVKAPAPKIAIFRVPWRLAARIGVDPAEYVAAVSEGFSDERWAVTSWVSPDGADLFVTALARKYWNGNEPLSIEKAASGPVLAEIGRPQEMLLALGYPSNFALHNASVSPKLIEGIVVVHNARAAVSGALKAVR